MRLTTFVALGLVWIAPGVASAAECAGDCDLDGSVSPVEIRSAVEIALLDRARGDCLAADVDGDQNVTAEELVLAVRAANGACAGGPTPTPTPTATPAPTATQTPGGGSQVPPTNAPELLAWLEAGSYRSWHAESEVHASVGPHFGRVRTFLNDAVFDSLAAGSDEHPRTASLVKELYGSSGDSVRGWSVMVKTEELSDGGQGWYWLERFNGSTFANGNGVQLCYGCHGNPPYPGIMSKDYVLTPFPLQ